MLNEECHLTLVIRALQINMTCAKVRASASRRFFQVFIDLKSNKEIKMV